MRVSNHAGHDRDGVSGPDDARELGTVRSVLVAAIAISIVHYADNTLRFNDYVSDGADRRTPDFVTALSIPVSWVLFTAAGIGSYVLLRRGSRSRAAGLLAVYSLSGLVGPLHYRDVSPWDFDLYQNAFILADTIVGVVIVVLAFRIARGRPAVGQARRPAPAASLDQKE